MRSVCLGVLLAITIATPITAKEKPRKEIFYMEMPVDAIAMTHHGKHILPSGPPGIAHLTEPAIQNSLILMAKLRNETGEIVGTASESEWFPNPQDMTQPWHASWTIMLPGRGHIVGFELEKVSPKAKPIFDTVAAGQEWTGDHYEQVAVGPLKSGDGVILGGSGEFEGATGTMSEWARLTRMTATGVMYGRIELHVTWTPAKTKKK
jgi:hypothetical protein